MTTSGATVNPEPPFATAIDSIDLQVPQSVTAPAVAAVTGCTSSTRMPSEAMPEASSTVKSYVSSPWPPRSRSPLPPLAFRVVGFVIL